MLLIIYCSQKKDISLTFFFSKNWDSIKQFTYIFINNKELIPYMFSVTTWVYTFIKRLQVVANLLTDIRPIYGAPC